MSKRPQLTDKQKLFCQRWLIHRNKARAYKEAYETNDMNVCAVEGHRNLTKPNIRAFLDKKLEEIEDSYKMDLDKCLKGLFRIANSNIMDYMDYADMVSGEIDLSDVDYEKASAIQELTTEERYDEDGNLTKKTKIKLYDKKSVLLDLAKYFDLGGFKTKVEHSVSVELAERIRKGRERSKQVESNDRQC